MTSATKFNPTEDQLRLLKVFQDADYAITVKEACSRGAVERYQYYRWHDHDDFREWWKSELDRFMTLGISDVLANLREGATRRFAGGKEPDAKPDAALVKLYLERFDRDYLPKSRQEQTGANGQPLQAPINVFMVGANPPKQPETQANPPIPSESAPQDAPGSTISIEDDQQDGEDVLS